MTTKLNDTQLIMMSAAAQREDRCLPTAGITPAKSTKPPPSFPPCGSKSSSEATTPRLRRAAQTMGVERTFSWFGRNRRLAKDYENLADPPRLRRPRLDSNRDQTTRAVVVF